MSERKKRHPFLRGLRDSFGLPALGLIAALTGFGVQAREAGLGLDLTFAAVATVWAMPALMSFVELFSAGSSPWLVLLTLLVINVRNLPMVVSVIPVIRSGPGFRWKYLMAAQLLSPTSWVQMMVIGRGLPAGDRLPYYTAFSGTLLSGGMLGTWVGYSWTTGLDPTIGKAFLLLTPLFVFLTMATAPKRSSRIGLIAGSVVVPVFMIWDPEMGLIFGGLFGGTLGFVLGRRLPTKGGV